MKSYTPVIGMEIHVELKTRSKMFCTCSADWFSKKPNTHTCPVCLGLPGALPVPNKTAIEWTQRLGVALNSTLLTQSKFDRKNYFYPDLPKGYQISQYDLPFCKDGHLEVNGKRIGIRRVHLEEDTGKLVHEKGSTLVDFNRSGVPLVEIVTEPDITSSDEAKAFLQELHRIIRYLGISDADMEKGSMRLEPNISLKESESESLPKYKVEVKNINSFNFVKRAIEYEIDRHTEILERGETPIQETRGWDEGKAKTYSQRVKEEAHDYRYFPEPDIPPFTFDIAHIEKIRSKIPKLPGDKRREYRKMGVKDADIEILLDDIALLTFFEQALDIVRLSNNNTISTQVVANWIVNKKVDIDKQNPKDLIDLIIEKSQRINISFDVVESAVRMVIKNNTKAVSDYKAGKTGVIMFLVGLVMKETKGKGDPTKVRELIKKRITSG